MGPSTSCRCQFSALWRLSCAGEVLYRTFWIGTIVKTHVVDANSEKQNLSLKIYQRGVFARWIKVKLWGLCYCCSSAIFTAIVPFMGCAECSLKSISLEVFFQNFQMLFHNFFLFFSHKSGSITSGQAAFNLFIPLSSACLRQQNAKTWWKHDKAL